MRWTPTSLEALGNVTSCLDRQYTQLSGTEDSSVTERTSQDTSRHADNGALSPVKQVFDAYASKFTQSPSSRQGMDGLSWSHFFYVAYAQAHCPERAPAESSSRRAVTVRDNQLRDRVTVPLSNDPAFREAFGCRTGSTMRPDLTCSFWVR